MSIEDNAELIAPFSIEEVKEAVWSCDGNKSPGPDGFNLNFIKNSWELLEADIIKFMNEFHSNAKLPKAISSSFIALISMVKHPQKLKEFRPISLIGCIYKILAKVLATRLKKVLGKVISTCQNAFLPNRQILDGFLVLNEVIDWAKRSKESCLLLKVDFERAYDSVNWNFLKYMLNRMGFCSIWIGWIMECVCSKSISVLVNSSPTKEFVAGKGLKQGDPLAPFLFLIIAEGLTGLVTKAVDVNLFKGYVINNSISFPILQFADDTILMCEGNRYNLWCLKSILRTFELASGLRVNFSKSNIFGINVSNDFLAVASCFLHCCIGHFPFKFIGIPIGANPRRASTWKPIVEATRKQLSTWKGRQLSIGGRITLINSTLSSLPLYFFSFYKAPICVIKELSQIQRNFLWGGAEESRKIAWLKWEKVCLPKN